MLSDIGDPAAARDRRQCPKRNTALSQAGLPINFRKEGALLSYRRLTVEPRTRRFQLRREPKERGFVAEAADELRRDG